MGAACLDAASIPGARFVSLPSRSHILLDTDPAWLLFCAELEKFLDEEEPTQRAVRPSVPSVVRPMLTGRELQVLRLVAEGKTDREIASDLQISVRTAGNHVKNILAKTQCTNRTVAATYAIRAGLA